jgi:FMN phosphatase YigB (HAD superfamily)
MPGLFEGALDILTELKEKFVLILVSCGKEEPQKKVIKHNNLERIFDDVIICSKKESDTFLKPKNFGEEKLSKLGGKSERVVMIGDSKSQNIAPAQAVGFETVWIPRKYDPGNARTCKPDHRIKSLLELREILLGVRKAEKL